MLNERLNIPKYIPLAKLNKENVKRKYDMRKWMTASSFGIYLNHRLVL